MESRESLIYDLGKSILRPIGILQLIALAMVITSPIIWIWVEWSLAWKVGLTGIVSTIILAGIYAMIKNIIGAYIDKIESDLREEKEKKNRFREKIEELMNKE